MKKYIKAILMVLVLSATLVSIGCNNGSQAPAGTLSSSSVKVGLLHSLSGTMTLSETPVRDAERLAIEEINASGGVLGRKIEVLEEDGRSNPNTFAERADKLLKVEGVNTIFGCWTSASRKAVIPIVEEHDALLWYPIQYEGFESSPNVVYTGSTLNQQIIPTIDYLLKNGRKRMFLLGSDYVFPRTAGKVIKAQLVARLGDSGKLLGEVVSQRAADAAVRQRDDVLDFGHAAFADEVGVDVHGADVVHDDGRLQAPVVRQGVVQKRRLASTEVPSYEHDLHGTLLLRHFALPFYRPTKRK